MNSVGRELKMNWSLELFDTLEARFWNLAQNIKAQPYGAQFQVNAKTSQDIDSVEMFANIETNLHQNAM